MKGEGFERSLFKSIPDASNFIGVLVTKVSRGYDYLRHVRIMKVVLCQPANHHFLSLCWPTRSPRAASVIILPAT
eukprot:1144150-Pelagomonas_calceolata.AAC.2